MKNVSEIKPFFLGLLLLPLVGFLSFRYYTLSTHATNLEAQHETAVDRYKNTIQQKDKEIEKLEEANEMLSDSLVREQNKNAEFQDQISTIGKTVGTLEKLSKTDPELLQKYSKVYFLNEHYLPPRLSDIPDQYVYPPGETEMIHAKVWPRLEALLEDAENHDIKLRIVSAFRSYGEQADLKARYQVTYGSGANTFSADQGYSEHQLGTTLDFSTESLAGTFTEFGETEAFSWLTNNAHKYGFILSYPEGNDYYQYEPWHWRYVGEELARDLHESGQSFYDLDQREIDEYLINLFEN